MVKKTITITDDSRLQAIVETAVEGIITINIEGVIQSVNPAAEKIFAYSAKELIGENIKCLMPKPYSDQHDAYIKQYLATGEPKIIGVGREANGLRKDGTEFPIWLAVAEYYEGEKRYFTGFIADLSIEKKYLQKATSLEQILEHSLNEIYIFDAYTLKFIRVNQGALTNLQYSIDEMLERTPIDIKPEHTLESFEELMRPLRNNEIDKLEFTAVHRRKDQTSYPVEVHLEFTEYESKQVFVAIILDITERIAAEAKIKVNQELLAHMDRVSILGEMSAGIAHEINQPLTAITTYANAGRRRAVSEEIDVTKISELFEKISASAHHAGNVIARLRKLLRPQVGQMESVDINMLITESISLIKTDSRTIEFEIVTDLEKNMPSVIADPVQIQQVILNLLRNSMDAEIVANVENKVIRICTTFITTESRIQVSVWDCGPGISHESAEKLFLPFYTTKASGMGVGLAICHSILQAHRGKLWFSNNPDAGVTFCFTLPTALNNGNE